MGRNRKNRTKKPKKNGSLVTVKPEEIYEKLEEETFINIPREIKLKYSKSPISFVMQDKELGKNDFDKINFGSEHLSTLISLARDIDFLNSWYIDNAIIALYTVNPNGFKKYHLLELCTFFTLSDDYEVLRENVGNLFTKIGEKSIPFLKYVIKSDISDYPRNCAAECLKNIAINNKGNAKVKTKVEETLIEILSNFENESTDFNGFILCMIVDLKSKKAIPIIRKLFQADMVDETDVGDYESVLLLLGAEDLLEDTSDPLINECPHCKKAKAICRNNAKFKRKLIFEEHKELSERYYEEGKYELALKSINICISNEDLFQKMKMKAPFHRTKILLALEMYNVAMIDIERLISYRFTGFQDDEHLSKMKTECMRHLGEVEYMRSEQPPKYKYVSPTAVWKLGFNWSVKNYDPDDMYSSISTLSPTIFAYNDTDTSVNIIFFNESFDQKKINPEAAISAISNFEDEIVVARLDYKIIVYDLSSENGTVFDTCHIELIHCVKINKKWIISYCFSGLFLSVINRETREEGIIYGYSTSSVHLIGDSLIVGYRNGIREYELNTLNLTTVYRTKSVTPTVFNIVFDSRFVIMGESDNNINIWKRGSDILIFKFSLEDTHAVCLSEIIENHIAIATYDGRIILFNLELFQVTNSWDTHNNCVTDLSMSYENTRLKIISAGKDFSTFISLHETQELPIETCFNCSTPLEITKKCGKCQSSYYCRRQCQSHHWKHHKITCIK